MNKRKFKVRGTMPPELMKEIQEHRDFLMALKEKNNAKLEERGIDLKLVEDGLRILKTKK